MDGDSPATAGRNESLFREVNEAIERGLWPGDDQSGVRFRCECAQFDCNRMLQLSVREYERVREHPRWFVVVAGHEAPAVEVVVETHGGYVVVEKQGAAGQEARERDPRS